MQVRIKREKETKNCFSTMFKLYCVCLFLIIVCHKSLQSLSKCNQFSDDTSIRINNCNRTGISDDEFAELSELRNISLAHNLLETLPINVFDHQANLEELDLSYNRLTILDDGIFNGTNVLRVLRLSHNRLSEISE